MVWGASFRASLQGLETGFLVGLSQDEPWCLRQGSGTGAIALSKTTA
ncbi:hypothetical protein [Laspinema olomoucense]|uniref:Uncharacterized protein n=1 Tax=Laspinema olomoucense D3b TaxID=2953688 RepID=A0ABT2NCW9_9CYAN|nr:hypothetical protein [Laspinema sp. D3b]MCT7974669.1 hypothetical protein [Laspinema sp. D3d]MCT7980539.1 hypothetical protein [Laspinema sp. D3b]MCT7989231.1 hypothetical protein [Laspinema sp. D3a]